MTEANVSLAGNLTDDPELRHTEGGITQAMFRVAVSGRREQEASFFTVIVWRDQDDEEPEPVASSTSDATVRDAGEGGAACRRPAPLCPCC
jgi:Single-strand binding protein family